ncbi:MAG: terminase family protein [Desulfovibrionaceae bacterium]|nr:terminase family protein [Desulfovibrionaceae bacterium]
MRGDVIPYESRYPEIEAMLEGVRFSVLVAHRRFGKTVLAVNRLLKLALECQKERGFFAYVAPFRNQAKSIAWAYMKRYSAGIEGRKVQETELSVRFENEATIRLFGADNPDALRGMYFDSVVLDEVAQMKPEIWAEIIRPALADREGSALFIGTPKGINLFSEMYHRAAEAQAAGDPNWLALSFPVTQTTALKPEEVERLKEELSENTWRQEMLCDFNASSDDSLIPLDVVSEGRRAGHGMKPDHFSPLVLGVDVARFGDDASVIFPRRGKLAMMPTVLHKVDNMTLADAVGEKMARLLPQGVYIDNGGGGGVIDRLTSLGLAVSGVHFGGRALDSERFHNRRAEMWFRLAEWLKNGGALPDLEALAGDLSAIRYFYDSTGKMKLESKEDIKARIGRSPDLGDALALTFAVNLPGLALGDLYGNGTGTAYDPLAW